MSFATAYRSALVWTVTLFTWSRTVLRLAIDQRLIRRTINPALCAGFPPSLTRAPACPSRVRHGEAISVTARACPFTEPMSETQLFVRHCADAPVTHAGIDALPDERCMAAGKRPTCPRSEIRTALFHACPSTGLRWHEKTGKNSHQSGIRAGSCLCRRKPGEPSRDLRCDPGLFSNASMLPLTHPRHKNSLVNLTREFAFPGNLRRSDRSGHE